MNISARSLLDDDFVKQVSEVLARHGVPAALLELEVTESAIMLEPERAHRLLSELHTIGVRISIDDFGAGYTNLGQLKNLPISEIKVDKSFVLTMITDHGNALIVRSVIELGHRLGLSVVAEGVETAEAITALTEYRCDLAQGYYISRPLAAEAFFLWYSQRRVRAPSEPTKLLLVEGD